MSQTNPIHTFEARIDATPISNAVLQEFADLFSKVERKLFVDLMKGKKAAELKSDYLRRYEISARHFNACRVGVEGKIQSRKELQTTQIQELKLKIQKLEKKRTHSKSYLKLKKLKQKLLNLESDQENEIVRICFGTKKLFRAQFHLEEAGYKNFEQWNQAWIQARNSHFFLLGSKDETSGNQSCVATIQSDEKLTLRIRLPDALRQYGKYLTLSDIYFPYGHDRIITSLKDCFLRNSLQRSKDPNYRHYGQAISFRFKRDQKGWRVFTSTALTEPIWQTSSAKGVIGIDINADHLALAEVDYYGNPISKYTIPLNLYGKTKNQSLALIGDACAKVIDRALCTQKDIVIENLNFQQKKAALSELKNKRYSRMLCSFAYQTITQSLQSRAWRMGVVLHKVNPAFTSIIGRIKYAERYGLTTHQAAALCIGRRFFGFSERAPRQAKAPDGKGGHVTFFVPVRNRKKHEWTHWREISRKFRAVLAAHFRTAHSRSADPPKTGPCDRQLPKVVGGIPTRESLAMLLG